MLTRYRHRRGPYALAEPSPAGGIARKLIAWAVIAIVIYFLIKWALMAMGVGNHLERKSVQLDVENRSNVTVSLDGGLMQHADKRLKLLPEDTIVSNAGGHAMLTFFDGTMLRMDEQSEVTVDESSMGTASSDIAVTLSRGAIWARTPSASDFSGAIMRTVVTQNYSATLPADAEVVLGAHTVLVFSADGAGVLIQASGADDVYVGEGQQLLVPEAEAFIGDLGRYRTAMDPLAVRRAFIEESRMTQPVSGGTGATGVTPPADVNLITIEMPVDGQTVSGSTVRVQGKVGVRIERVRVNGYPASIDRSQGIYSQELAMPGTDTFTIRVEALDRTGVVVEQQERTVKPASAGTALAPTITKPGKNGETVHTAADEVEIRGTVPSGTTAIYVNDYKLQLFRAGDPDWSYLASKRFDNLKDGDNVFNVVAVDTTGARSAPATITVVIGANGPTTPAGATTSSAAPTVNEATLPTNAPLKPGTLAVTAPSGGTSTTFTGTGFLLEGTTIAETASVWVNGYQLKLYSPGKTFWNYWATAAYGTLKKGSNVYRIVSRNKDNQILDTFTYTVEYNP